MSEDSSTTINNLPNLKPEIAFYTIAEVARILNTTEAAVRQSLYRGGMGRSIPPAVKIDGRWRFPRRNLEKWLARQEQAADETVEGIGGTR